MKSLFKIAFHSLFANKKKSLFVLLTIVLCTAMIFTVSAFFASFMQSVVLDGIHHYFRSGRTLTEARMMTFSDPDYMCLSTISTVFVLTTVLGGGTTIYNILSVTTSERSKTLSVLSTLGAGLYHKLMYIFFEAAFACIIAIPLGIALGCACSVPLTNQLDALISTLSQASPSPFLVGHPVPFCLVIAIISACTVFAAFTKPFLGSLRKASVEGAKASGSINVSFKDNLLDKFMLKKFGIVGKLASCNYTNNKAKYRRLSWCVSIFSVLFISLKILKIYMPYIIGTNSEMNYFFDLLAVLLIIVFILALIGAAGIFYVTFDKRKAEFAMLKSIGAEDITLLRMVFLECVYCGIYTMLFTVISSFIADEIIYSAVIMTEPKAITFEYPFVTLAATLSISLTMTVLLSLFMALTVKRVNIIEETKKNY